MMVESRDGNLSAVVQVGWVEVVVLDEGPLLMLLGQNMVGEYLVCRHRGSLGLSKMMGLFLKTEDDKLLHSLRGELFGVFWIGRKTWPLENA